MHTRSIGPFLSILLPLCLPFQSAFAEKEAIVYSQDNYEAGSLDCANYFGSLSLDNLQYSDDIAEKWQDEIDSWGTFGRNYIRYDTAAENEDLVDDDVDPESKGTDHTTSDGIDTFDIALVVARGTAVSGSPDSTWIFMVDTDFAVTQYNEADLCTVDVHDETYFGNIDLNQTFFFGDRTLNYETWDEGGFSGIDTGNYALFAGFHGPKTERGSDDNDMDDFVRKSEDEEVGKNWIGEFVQRPWGSNNDDCPTVVIFSSNSSQALDYYHDAGLSYWPTLAGAHSGTTIIYPTNCDPPGNWESSL